VVSQDFVGWNDQAVISTAATIETEQFVNAATLRDQILHAPAD
jgi:hypothetical protein